MKIGEVGILQTGDEKVALKLIEVYKGFNGNPILRGEIMSDVFARSNNRFARFAYGYDLATPSIKNVIFNDPATIVIWSDDSKTVVKCQPDDTYSKETGLALCIAKKYLGNKGNFNEVFKKWIPEENENRKFRIIETCYGCRGAEGLIGRKTNKPKTAGLLDRDEGYNVEVDDGNVWRINLDAKIRYLK